MKEKLIFFITTCIILSGCGSNDTRLNTNQIQYKDKILSYNTNNVDDVFFDDGINIKLNEENKVRFIEITNEDVITYNDISVGDKISKAKSKYKYDNENENCLSILFDDNSEIDPFSLEEINDDLILINYFFENDVISKIQINDAEYAKKLK